MSFHRCFHDKLQKVYSSDHQIHTKNKSYKSLIKHQTNHHRISSNIYGCSMGAIGSDFSSPCSLGVEGIRWWTQRLRCHGTCRWSCIHLIGDGCHSITTSISHGGNGIPSSAPVWQFQLGRQMLKSTESLTNLDGARNCRVWVPLWWNLLGGYQSFIGLMVEVL